MNNLFHISGKSITEVYFYNFVPCNTHEVHFNVTHPVIFWSEAKIPLSRFIEIVNSCFRIIHANKETTFVAEMEKYEFYLLKLQDQ